MSYELPQTPESKLRPSTTLEFRPASHRAHAADARKAAQAEGGAQRHVVDDAHRGAEAGEGAQRHRRPEHHVVHSRNRAPKPCERTCTRPLSSRKAVTESST